MTITLRLEVLIVNKVRQKSSKNSQTILVVEDMDDTRSMVKIWLRGRGFRVIEAKDGTEAVAVAKREHPTLILMDIGIGPQSGLASVSQIREDKRLRRIPVVALTAYDSPGLRLEAKTIGFSEYVTKPFDPNLLGALIDRLLKKSSN